MIEQLAAWRGVKLHLGCGEHRLDGWINVDGQPNPRADLVLDLHADLECLPDGGCGWIYAAHVIEHLYPDKLPEVLAHLCRALEPGGRLTLATTDLIGIFEHRFLEADEGNAWEAALFGEVSSTDHPMAAHRNCFTYDKLADLLAAAGFARVRPWRTEQYPEIHALDDYARSCSLVTCFAEGVR